MVLLSECSWVAGKLTCLPATGSQSFPGLLLNPEPPPPVRSISTGRGRSGGEQKVTTLAVSAGQTWLSDTRVHPGYPQNGRHEQQVVLQSS